MQNKKAKKRTPSHAKSGGAKKSFWAIAAVIAVIAVCFTSSHLMNKNNQEFLKTQYPIKYSEYVEEYCRKYNVSKALVYAVIRTESGFREDAGSSAGALGLMQIIPETFEWLQLMREAVGDYVTDDLYKPEINIDYGVYFLSYLLEKYESEECAVAAYNAGFGAVDEWLETPENSSDGIHLDYIPFDETREYVKRVESAKEMYQQIYGF